MDDFDKNHLVIKKYDYVDENDILTTHHIHSIGDCWLSRLEAESILSLNKESFHIRKENPENSCNYVVDIDTSSGKINFNMEGRPYCDLSIFDYVFLEHEESDKFDNPDDIIATLFYIDYPITSHIYRYTLHKLRYILELLLYETYHQHPDKGLYFLDSDGVLVANRLAIKGEHKLNDIIEKFEELNNMSEEDLEKVIMFEN